MREPADIERFIRENTALAAPPLVPELRLYTATELTPLWRATAAVLERYDMPPPFWAFPWAGGQALARYVLDHPALVRGKSVIDFAAGGGLVGIAARRAGAATVLASEIDRFAVVAMRLNAAANGVTLEPVERDLLEAPLGDAEVVLAGDIYYEPALSQRGLAWLQAHAARGALCLTGDPGRIHSPTHGRTLVAEYEVETSPEIEEGARRVGRVWGVSA